MLESVQWSRAHTALAEGLSLAPTSTSGGSQQPATPAPGVKAKKTWSKHSHPTHATFQGDVRQE